MVSLVTGTGRGGKLASPGSLAESGARVPELGGLGAALPWALGEVLGGPCEFSDVAPLKYLKFLWPSQEHNLIRDLLSGKSLMFYKG